MINLKHRLKLLKTINGSQMKFLIRLDDESDEDCINRSIYKYPSRINLIVISESDARL